MVTVSARRSGRAPPGPASKSDQAMGPGAGLEWRSIGDASIWEGKSVTERRRAVLRMDFDTLVEILDLPEGTEILAIDGGGRDLVGMCGIVVEHPSLHIVRPMERAPIYTPRWSPNMDGVWEFDDWGKA